MARGLSLRSRSEPGDKKRPFLNGALISLSFPRRDLGVCVMRTTEPLLKLC